MKCPTISVQLPLLPTHRLRLPLLPTLRAALRCRLDLAVVAGTPAACPLPTALPAIATTTTTNAAGAALSAFSLSTLASISICFLPLLRRPGLFPRLEHLASQAAVGGGNPFAAHCM